ncbi:hypothetical protein BT96DRAFT_945369 [Gymnopus androsaceus JB14]|uniref:Uncharacterized protein n=1 Tax=Gymnopus androsaceus JB14 TaxID=1447944 RepID=A0A6A4H055_9AGAR|nr:hypothetical protein BT96DRAFT_945369 [Gymnopus androsaceus JB14]
MKNQDVLCAEKYTQIHLVLDRIGHYTLSNAMVFPQQDSVTQGGLAEMLRVDRKQFDSQMNWATTNMISLPYRAGHDMVDVLDGNIFAILSHLQKGNDSTDDQFKIADQIKLSSKVTTSLTNESKPKDSRIGLASLSACISSLKTPKHTAFAAGKFSFKDTLYLPIHHTDSALQDPDISSAVLLPPSISVPSGKHDMPPISVKFTIKSGSNNIPEDQHANVQNLNYDKHLVFIDNPCGVSNHLGVDYGVFPKAVSSVWQSLFAFGLVSKMIFEVIAGWQDIH